IQIQAGIKPLECVAVRLSKHCGPLEIVPHTAEHLVRRAPASPGIARMRHPRRWIAKHVIGHIGAVLVKRHAVAGGIVDRLWQTAIAAPTIIACREAVIARRWRAETGHLSLLGRRDYPGVDRASAVVDPARGEVWELKVRVIVIRPWRSGVIVVERQQRI